MSSSVIKDVLSWEKFQEETLKETVYPPKTIELYNRLVASTNNFFVIAPTFRASCRFLDK